MKNLCKKIVTAFVFVAALQSTQAQDLHFSQFFEAPLLRNPSLAGILPATSGYRVFTAINGTALPTLIAPVR